MRTFKAFLTNEVRLCSFYYSLLIYYGAFTCKIGLSVLKGLLFVVLLQVLLQDFIARPHFIYVPYIFMPKSLLLQQFIFFLSYHSVS